MAVISSASLILGLAAATPAAATPHTFGAAQLDGSGAEVLDQPVRRFAHRNQQCASPHRAGHDALLSVTPPKDLDNADVQFPVRADDFERLGDDEP